MRRNTKRFGLSLAALMLVLLLVGTAVLAPCLVSAEDGEGGVVIQDSRGIRTEGSGGGEPVAPPLGSPGADDILFEQPPVTPYDSWAFMTSALGSGYLCMDDFWGLTGDIGDIHWWGMPAYCCWYDCDPTGMELEIIFYEDDGGYPGAQVAVFSNVIPSITYYDIFSGIPAYLFEAELGTPVSLTEGWVSIESTYSPHGCWFLWGNSFTGNSNAIQWPLGYIGDNLAFVLTEAPPPLPNVKYLHSTGGLFNLTEPVDTQWLELLHIYGREYHLSSWEDNGDGVLSYCDTINMYEKPDGELRPYHVENVTITLLVTENRTGESMYIELEGGFNESALMNPIGTQWHEVYPKFYRTYTLTGWDVNVGNVLDYCDYISFTECEYSICLTDSYGDGWNGGFVNVYVNGNPVYTGLTLDSGYGPECHPIPVQNGDEITVYYTAGSWPEENAYYIYDSKGLLVWLQGWPPGDVFPGELYAEGCIWWHVEEVAVDIIVTPEPPPVGGEAYPVSKAALLAPWVAVAVLLASGTCWYILKRRKA